MVSNPERRLDPAFLMKCSTSLGRITPYRFLYGVSSALSRRFGDYTSKRPPRTGLLGNFVSCWSKNIDAIQCSPSHCFSFAK